MYLYLRSINDKVSFVELLEFTQSTSQRLCQHFHSKVKVSYFILNVKLLHYSFSLPFKHHFLNCLYLCWLFIGAVCSSVSRMRWFWGYRDFCIFLPLNLSARGAVWEDRCASAERAGSTRKIHIGLSWDSLHLFCLNTKVEAAWTHFSSYACGKSEWECQLACLLLRR